MILGYRASAANRWPSARQQNLCVLFWHKKLVSRLIIKSEKKINQNIYEKKIVNTNNFSGLVDLDKVLVYTTHRAKYIPKGRGPDFANAVKSLEEYMSDRVVNNSTTTISVSFDMHGIIHFITNLDFRSTNPMRNQH